MFNNYFFLLKKDSSNYCLNNFSGYLKIQVNNDKCTFDLSIQNLNPDKSIIYKCYLLCPKDKFSAHWVGDLDSDSFMLSKTIELKNGLLEGYGLDDYNVFCIYAISKITNKIIDLVCSCNKSDNYSWKNLITSETLGLISAPKVNRAEPEQPKPIQHQTRQTPSKQVPPDYIASSYLRTISSILTSNFAPIMINNMDSSFTFYEISDYNILSYLFFCYGLGHLLLSPYNCSIGFNQIRRIAIGVSMHCDYITYIVNDNLINIDLTTGNIKKNASI